MQKKPQYIDEVNVQDFNTLSIDNLDLNKCLLNLLSHPNITSKQYIYSQYDSTVRTNTIVGPGSDSAVIRLKNTNKSLAIKFLLLIYKK